MERSYASMSPLLYASKSQCIKQELAEKQRQVENFLKFLAEDYGTSVNRAVTETQTQLHRRKEVTLPSTEDVKIMYSYIINQRSKYFTEVKSKFSPASWRKLGETALLSLLIFNRRRPGELESLHIEDFWSYRGINDMSDKEIYGTLSAEGKALRHVRFEIRGKRNRSVPVLVDEDVLECLKIIVEYQGAAGVPETNLCLFGLPSDDKDRDKFLRACDLMREYSKKCTAAIPHLLRGTKLRKHIATRCIHLNLDKTRKTRKKRRKPPITTSLTT
nr:PREDICTED: uncharacterized protein LOC105272398 [Fopius arisanus]